MHPRLQVHGIHKRYGGVHALRRVSFDLAPGEVHALVGENGAGKSTLLRIVAGSETPDGGEIRIEGSPVTLRTPLDSQRAGIGIVYQELDLFPNLTAGENIVAGNLFFDEGAFVSQTRIETFCRPFLDQVGLNCDTLTPVSDLAIAHRQLLAAARALSMNCRVLLLDEPTSSLFDDAVERLFAVIGKLKTTGVSIVYVSHKMDEIFRITNRITVLRDGESISTLEAPKTNPNEIVQLMVGRPLELTKRTERTPGKLLLSVSNLTTAKLRGVTFHLHAGEVLGIAGLVGAGRSELGAALYGIDRILPGEIHLNGQPYTPTSPANALRAGIALLPEDRKLDGLMMHMSVLENSVMAAPTEPVLHPAREAAAIDPACRALALKCESYQATVDTLSGGNQQKTLLVRILLANPNIVFLDDPARGVDIAAKEDIYKTIGELAAAGKGILFVSSELPELLRCSDRILVMNEGRIAQTLPIAEATQENIMAAATSALPIA